MTLQLNRVVGAKYDAGGMLDFELLASVDGAAEGTVFHCLGGDYPDVDAACVEWLASNTPTAYQPVEITVNNLDVRRQEREAEFAKTIDKMNPVWWDSFTQTQKDEIAAWRQAWLQYPNSLGATRPVKPSCL